MVVQTIENSSFTYLLIFATNNDTDNMDSWTQYNTAQYNTVQYKTIQYSTRQLAGTPQQLKPITVGPFSVYTYNYIQISAMFRNNR